MQIKAKVIQDSVQDSGVRIITMELEYPRFIHSEFMTHRVFSRNAASSRAIPIATMMKQVWNNPAMPVYWGANRSGMQAGVEVKNIKLAKLAWKFAAKMSVLSAYLLAKVGLHKQTANRVLEPFQLMKTVVTATDWQNFFELRNHKDAQPEIQALAIAMKKAQDESIPMLLGNGEWHVPYVDRSRGHNDEIIYFTNKEPLSIEDALKVSASCCAQVSYRQSDVSVKKALRIYEQLVNNTPVHASPFEHQAKPLKGTSVRSGNLLGFMQYRKVIEGL